MLSFALRHPVSFLFSVALHGIVAVALVIGVEFDSGNRVIPQQAIQARVVDQAAIERERERIAEAEAAAQAERDRQEREAREAAERERELEEQRLAEIERERQAAERAEREREDQLRVQREREAQEAREREAEAEAERQRQAELERQRQEEERRQAEAERQRREEEERRRAEEERQRLAAEAEARKQAELEAELSSALAAEEERRAAEDAGLLDQYLRAIQSQIERNWIAPPTARPGLECVINVTQIPSGDVVGVSFGACNGDDAVKRSIEAAVLRSSPLPRPPVPSLFNRSVVVTFKPEV